MTELPDARRVLVVSAHPDDESFGMGAIISRFTDRGADVSVLCFTRGEASTLGAHRGDLASIRAAEMDCAAAALGLAETRLFDYPDGRLQETPLKALVAHIEEAGEGVDLLLVFDELGITGHHDHQWATKAAVTWAEGCGIPVLSWVVSEEVADALNAEFGTTFVGRADAEVDIALTIDRGRQLEAIACHGSQAEDNPVLWRRLELHGDRELLRYLSRPT